MFEDKYQDITLRRIISLLPHKADGSLVHGARTELMDYLGIPRNTFAEWVGERSRSYRNYLYQIAVKYDVSIEWLLGKTDIKKSPAVAETTTEEVSPLRQTAIELLNQLDEAQLANFVGLFSSFRKQK